MQARLVLADCRAALEQAELPPDPVAFRRSWAAVVALLRAVGHVLDKVDGRRSESLRRAIDARWRIWNANRAGNRAYWNFIEAERNNILKVYDFGDKQDEKAGRPDLDAAKKALAWWAAELDAIEAAAGEHGA
ncbi:MAG: hypothetical protein DMF79_09475 [Acidobacteria bacterium]|nr:MAG: hypothetical protein DMF79_09475 [Acidobacteriota bacterium]